MTQPIDNQFPVPYNLGMTLRRRGYLAQIRDSLIYHLLDDRPELNYTEIGEIFGISRQMVRKVADKRRTDR